MSPRRDAGTSSRHDVGTSRHFWVRMNNVVTLGANVETLLEIYKQRRDVGHERRDVARFSSNEKSAKIQSLGLLHTSKLLFLLTILDHLMTIYIKNNTGSKPFHTKNLIFETLKIMSTKNLKLSTLNRF